MNFKFLIDYLTNDWYISAIFFLPLYRLLIDLNKKKILIVFMIIFHMNISMLFIVNFGN